MSQSFLAKFSVTHGGLSPPHHQQLWSLSDSEYDGDINLIR